MQVGERYSKLLQIASENSSEKRRALLTEITDLFFGSLGDQSPEETKLFGDVIAKVAYELDVEVRRELSQRFSGGQAPRTLAVAMANDEIAIAGPILRRSRSLTQNDLIQVVEKRGHAHQMMVTLRPDVGEELSDSLVSHGDDRVVAALVINQSSRVSNDTFDKIVDRAANNQDLHRPIVKRRAITPEHLNRMYMIVEGPMRREILARNAEFSEEEVEIAMRRAQTRVAIVNGTLPPDFETVNRQFMREKAAKMINRGDLPALWRNKEMTKFLIAFSDFTGIEFHQTMLVFEKKDIDILAMLCRGANFDRALFVTIAVLVLGEEGLAQAKILGAMYHEVPPEAAQRAIRFLRLKANVNAQAA
jgi:uncharacterized protein (DUF2336 family)